MKKFFTYPVFVVLFLSFIGMMGFGSIVKYHKEGGRKFKFLQEIVMTIASVPLNVRMMLKTKTLNIDKLEPLSKHKGKKRFKQFIDNERNALLVLPRYENSLNRAVVDIVDLKNFEVLHTYSHDIDRMNSQVKNKKEFPRLKIDNSKIRFTYTHPLILKDGSLTSTYGPAFKIDFCSKLLWINDEEQFHHSQMLDHDGNIWIGGRMKPQSKYVKKYSIPNYADDSIIKININGKILLNKSVTELLIENEIVPDNFAYNTSLANNFDPIHLNDIEPALFNSKYWKKGDVFISIRNQSAIIHYRPNTNEIINYITGPFAMQHDVDIISNKEISIFNNNNFFVNNDYTEIVIYNFETKTFKTLFKKELQEENFKTYLSGLSHILKDGSLMVEETSHGRIILFNSKGEKEWEFVNKDENGDIGLVNWIRVIEDEIFIKKYKSLIKNNKCLN
ncbi:arylsulfotransferase family protein [Candidatus Pelagibacter sp.]|uniref:arylsulfotransferase family protein n=1 Tax=Candidatus Pelagibacter sp. TaxID=2024849 RepID=UPI003D0A68AE